MKTTKISIELPELLLACLRPLYQRVRHGWLTHAEQHYLMCAEVEQQRVKEAQANVAYFHKQAALARSARH